MEEGLLEEPLNTFPASSAACAAMGNANRATASARANERAKPCRCCQDKTR